MLMCVYGSSPCLEGTVQNIQIYSVLLVCALLSHLAYWGFGKESMLFNRVLLLERAGEHWDLIVCMVLLLACTCCAYVVGRLTQCSWVDLDVCLFKENLFSYWCRIRTPLPLSVPLHLGEPQSLHMYSSDSFRVLKFKWGRYREECNLA